MIIGGILGEDFKSEKFISDNRQEILNLAPNLHERFLKEFPDYDDRLEAVAVGIVWHCYLHEEEAWAISRSDFLAKFNDFIGDVHVFLILSNLETKGRLSSSDWALNT